MKMNQQCHQELKHILEHKRIYPVFQPIVSLRDGGLLGYEALSRIDGDSTISNVEELFQMAVASGKIWELEQTARAAVFEALDGRKKGIFGKKLFLNVSPHVIYDQKFRAGFTREYIERYGILPSQIIFEITERESVKDLEGFKTVVEHYKKEHYQIAIDDVGSGYSGLNLICDIKPHYIKLDMNLVRGIHNNRMKYAMVKGLIELSNISNIRLIAEGIENLKELEALIGIGVHYGQGFWLGRPAEKMEEIDKAVLDSIKELNKKKHSMDNHGVDSFYIKNISIHTVTVSPDMKVEKVLSYFEENKEQPGVCIVDGNKVIGVLTREKLQQYLSGRYGYSLYQNKSISRIMDRQFLEVDSYSPVSAVSAMAMEREHDNLYDFIVVSKRGRYHGIVTIKDLLCKATEIDVNMARSANPLTGLPGNVTIAKEISGCINGNGSYTVLYLDLDNFKAYNDVYGFAKGDEIIRILSQVLKQIIGKDGFIGHIGGDDFVVVLQEDMKPGLPEHITSEFERLAHTLYTKEDKARGYIAATNRHGAAELFPLVSVTVVSVSGRERSFCSSLEVSEELTARKKAAKKSKENNYGEYQQKKMSMGKIAI